MSFLKSSYYNFTQDFFEKRIYPAPYKKIKSKLNNLDLTRTNALPDVDTKNIHLIEFIPDIIDLELNTDIFNSFKYKYFKGFMCNLKDSNNLKDYMVKQLGKKGESIALRRLRRLETCFDITYKTFVGSIDENECKLLLDDLKHMIEKRFNQRGENHSSLKNWSFYETSTYKMINENKAVLFVIYSNNVPIVISLDYLYQNIFESAISSYEIDYSKYGLGNTIIIKKLEWCFNNNYAVFNMRYGDYPYKRFWCNTAFDYESHVVYNKKSLIQMFKAYALAKKNHLTGYLIMNKDNFVILKKLKSLLSKNNKEQNLEEESNSVYHEIENHEDFKDLEHILLNINDAENNFLRKYIYDFQYVNSAKYNTVKVYKLKKDDNFIYSARTNNTVIYFTLNNSI